MLRFCSTSCSRRNWVRPRAISLRSLLKKGATLEQIQKMRQKYASRLEKTGMGQTADKAIGDATDRMRKNNGASP